MEPGGCNETADRGRAEGPSGHLRGKSGRAGFNSGASYGSHAVQQAKQANFRGLESPYTLESCISYGVLGEPEFNARAQMHDPAVTTSFRVQGLKDSKVASNPDGGLKDLLNFLERRASGSNTGPQMVRIMKVCLFVTIAGFPEVICRRLGSILASILTSTHSANYLYTIS